MRAAGGEFPPKPFLQQTFMRKTSLVCYEVWEAVIKGQLNSVSSCSNPAAVCCCLKAPYCVSKEFSIYTSSKHEIKPSFTWGCVSPLIQKSNIHFAFSSEKNSFVFFGHCQIDTIMLLLCRLITTLNKDFWSINQNNGQELLSSNLQSKFT